MSSTTQSGQIIICLQVYCLALTDVIPLSGQYLCFAHKSPKAYLWAACVNKQSLGYYAIKSVSLSLERKDIRRQYILTLNCFLKSPSMSYDHFQLLIFVGKISVLRMMFSCFVRLIKMYVLLLLLYVHSHFVTVSQPRPGLGLLNE